MSKNGVNICPSFEIIYFVPKLLQPAFKAIPRTPCTRLTPVQLGKTLLCPWPFAFHPRKPNAPIHFPSFYLPRQIHKNHPPALHRQQASISYNTSPFLFPTAPKNPRFFCSNGGHQASRRGSVQCPSGDPPPPGISYLSLPPIPTFSFSSDLQSLHSDDASSSSGSSDSEGPPFPGVPESTVEFIR